MWIDKQLFNPFKKGYYKCLVEWDAYESHQQFIRFWWANEEEYKIVEEKWDKQAF